MYNSPALSTYSTPMPIYHSYFQIKERQPAATEAAVHSPHSLAPLHKIENVLIPTNSCEQSIDNAAKAPHEPTSKIEFNGGRC
jgi:hypothetical protein